MKTILTHRSPRNPLIAPARFRRAGAHRPTGGSQRQQARRELQREIKTTNHSP